MSSSCIPSPKISDVYRISVDAMVSVKDGSGIRWGRWVVFGATCLAGGIAAILYWRRQMKRVSSLNSLTVTKKKEKSSF